MVALSALLRLLVASTGVASLAREAVEARSCESVDDCAAVDEDAEALLASTSLLQASLRQTRGSSASVEEHFRQASLGPLFRLKGRRDVEFLSAPDNGKPDHSKDYSDLRPLWQLVSSAIPKDDSDPIWASAHELVRRHLERQNPDNLHFVQLCKEGRLEQYRNKGCSANSPGQKLIGGRPADSYYCGVQSKGIDWSSATWKVNNLCSAESGSAYMKQGICGSLSKKQLVLNFFSTVPKWNENPVYINVPSVDCILGLGDCDIYYCQHCTSLCDPPSRNESEVTEASQ
eukprot:gb/GFBE01038675.1/.p1 GENE.gb/GFBE01038675.1/~~gb/GFBE01038675.1/.p1  ORF type:complete len:288 (+),score=39.77 gb/GFBE01038675.1/:1-864(+)